MEVGRAIYLAHTHPALGKYPKKLTVHTYLIHYFPLHKQE